MWKGSEQVASKKVEYQWMVDDVINQSVLWIQAGLGTKMGLQDKREWPACVTAGVLMAPL